ncbi:hypothetical protein Hdeb2414_s0007g00245651 [Helianthus debilis subsp. tardiflorus]
MVRTCLLWTLSRVMIHRMLCLLMLLLLRVRMLWRGSEHRFEGSGYVSVPNVKGFVKIPVDGKMEELRLVVGKDTKALSKKVGGSNPSGKAIEGSFNVDSGEIYVPDWKVTVSDSFKSPSVREDVLNHFIPPVVRASSSSMVDDQLFPR